MEKQAILKVYVDVVFIINFMMDAAVLWLTSRLLTLPKKKIGFATVVAPMIGAVYATAAQLYPYSLLNHPIAKFICSLVMVAIAYLPKNSWQWLRYMICFYLSSFAIGGVAMGLWFFVRSYDPGILLMPQGYDQLTILFIGVILTGICLTLVVGKAKRQLKLQSHLMDLAIEYGGKRINLTALLDTGHLLREPLTSGPVVCVSCSVLSYEMVQSLMKQGWADMPKIPYRTLTQNSQLTLFRPDGIWIKEKDQETWIDINDGWIGVVPLPLDQENRYQALVPDLFENPLKEPGKEVIRNEGMAEIKNMAQE